MATYEVELLGRTFEVEADNQNKALGMARLHVSRQSMTERAQAGATKRLGAVDQSGKVVAGPDNRYANYPRLPLGVELDPATTEGKINNAMLLAASGIPMVAAFRAAPLATSAAVAAGYGGSELGEAAGDKAGGFAEAVGAPKGTRAVLRTGGALAGGVIGGVKGAKVANAVRGAIAPAAAEAVVAREVPSVSTLQDVGKAARAEALAAGVSEQEAHEAAKAAITTAIRGGAPPATRGATALAVDVAEAPAVLPAGKRAMATNLGGKAKPGPAPTAPEDLEATLKASLNKIANAPPLKGPRIEVGAQKVGREVGMTKEEVRKATGPVLDEALGEASPILPKKALYSIIDTMKKIPPAEREAYVAKATSGKAKWQIENIRRTLEHLGLLLPVGVAAGVASQYSPEARK